MLPAQIEALAASRVSFLLVAECPSDLSEDATVCGTALFSLCQDVMYGTQPFGVVENVIVTAALQGSGMGRCLMAHVETLALEHDCTKLMLASSASRSHAHEFFRKCGYRGDSKLAFVKYRREFGMATTIE